MLHGPSRYASTVLGLHGPSRYASSVLGLHGPSRYASSVLGLHGPSRYVSNVLWTQLPILMTFALTTTVCCSLLRLFQCVSDLPSVCVCF